MSDERYRAKIDDFKNRSSMYETNAPQIDAILAETDLQARQALWLKTYMKKPKFDDPKNKMIYVHLEKEELDVIVRYLMNLK